MKLSIIILNYKQKAHVRQLLGNIAELTLPYELEVIVVDNGSHDGCEDIVTEVMPSATFIGLPKNLGYAAGNNAGLRLATGDYILILNPDVRMFDGAVEKLINFLETHPEAGLVGPRLINPDGSAQLSGSKFMSFWVPLWRRSSFGHWPRPRQQLQEFFYDGWDRTTSREVGWLIGAALLFHRRAFNDVGLLDENFFLYFEDVDYARRFWEKNWAVHYVADAKIIHYHSRTSAVNPGLSAVFSYATRLHIRSWLQYFKKYRGRKKPEHSM